VRRAQHAVSLTPYDPFLFYYDCVTGLAHLAAGNYQEAALFARKSARAVRPFSAAHRVLAIALVLGGRVEEARPVIEQLRTIEPALTVAGFRKRFPASQAAMLERYCEALARAGLPL
jgi:Flp pilus assembly protein TadD